MQYLQAHVNKSSICSKLDICRVPIYSAPRFFALCFQLANGEFVNNCDESNGWIGVVVNHNRKLDCGLYTVPTGLSTYTNPCKFDWINKNKLRSIAG